MLSVIPGGEGAPPEPDWTSLYSDILDLNDTHEEWSTATRELPGAQTLALGNGDAIRRLVEFRVQ